MARRIGLAQALINDPELLILDEPTAGMDPIGTRQIKDVIRDLGNRGKTILLSSHLLADVEDVCDRVTILYGGQERASGHTRELLSQRDQTRITTERLAPETIEQIKEMVRREEGKRVLEVATPADKLESFFLRIVEQAQAANIATSGARAAGKLPDFLSMVEPAGDQVIQSLVSAARNTQRVEPEPVRPSATAKPDVSRKVIEELTAAKQPKPTPAPAPTEAPERMPDKPAPTPRKPVEADRTVIDDLLRKKPDQSNDVDGA
jgi:ABC-2 type transport system ATP-binding protein